MDMICAHSSDRRTLYQADIYRVLALPKGHIVHFRYKKRYVDDKLLLDGTDIEGQGVVIFFTHGNSEKGNGARLSQTSVRWATMSHFEISDETDVFHAYLELGDSCNVAIDSGNSSEKRPPMKFLSRLTCTELSEENSWHNRINKVKDSFPKITFFHLKGIYRGRKELPIRCQDDGKSCHYRLVHGPWGCTPDITSPTETTIRMRTGMSVFRRLKGTGPVHRC